MRGNLFRRPKIADLTHQIRTRFEGSLARFPSGGRSFAGAAHILAGLDLAEEFSDTSSYACLGQFNADHDAVRINNKPAAVVQSGGIIINAIHAADLAIGIGEHGIRQTAIY